MPLLDLKTDLKSIKYGHDRPGGGDSNQPYIKTDINTVDKGINRLRLTNFDDGLIRGGIVGALNASIVDTIRISKFLTDFPKGPLFIVKQVGLQLSNPRLEVPKDRANILIGSPANALAASTNGLLEPTRIYNLGINTIAQIPVNAFGGHFSRHGILPVQNEASKYEAVVTANNKSNNRLVGLTTKFQLGDRKPNATIDRRVTSTINTILQTFSAVTGIPTSPIKVNPQDLIIDDYKGGPGSTYGILGRTTINRYYNTEDGLKINSSLNFSKQFAGYTRNEAGKSIDYNRGLGLGDKSITEYPDLLDIYFDLDVNNLPTSNNPSFKTYAALQKQVNEQQQLFNINKVTFIQSGSSSVKVNLNQFGIYDTDKKAYSSKDIGKIGYKNSYGDVVTINKPNWSEASREIRIGSGKTDLINLTPLFKDNGGSIKDTLINLTIPSNPDKNINDLVKFRIQAVETDTPTNSVWMIFRAYITALTDNVDASWNDVKYAGRGDSFYIYNGFTRKMSVSFKVAALSEQEMRPMYQKLNYLMSNLMPDYGAGNVMRGPLVRMTIGNYIDGQLCKLDSLSITVPNESPWEISINDTELILPHIIEVQLGFTPIGSQTQNINYTPQKSDTISNIAQNYNGAADPAGNYINPSTSSILQ